MTIPLSIFSILSLTNLLHVFWRLCVKNSPPSEHGEQVTAGLFYCRLPVCLSQTAYRKPSTIYCYVYNDETSSLNHNVKIAR